MGALNRGSMTQFRWITTKEARVETLYGYSALELLRDARNQFLYSGFHAATVARMKQIIISAAYDDLSCGINCSVLDLFSR